jgi:hypothetical protein
VFLGHGILWTNAFSARVSLSLVSFFLFHALGRRENVLMISALVLFRFLDLLHHAALSACYDRGLLCLLHPSYVFLISHVRFSLMTRHDVSVLG